MQWRGIIFDVLVALRHICLVESYLMFPPVSALGNDF